MNKKKIRFFGKIFASGGTLKLLSYYLCTVFRERGGVLGTFQKPFNPLTSRRRRAALTFV